MHASDPPQLPDTGIRLVEQGRRVFAEGLDAVEQRLVSTLDKALIEEHVGRRQDG